MVGNSILSRVIGACLFSVFLQPLVLKRRSRTLCCLGTITAYKTCEWIAAGKARLQVGPLLLHQQWWHMGKSQESICNSAMKLLHCISSLAYFTTSCIAGCPQALAWDQRETSNICKPLKFVKSGL